MSTLSGFFSRLRAVFTKRALDADFDAELAQHLEAATADNLHVGMTPDEDLETGTGQEEGETVFDWMGVGRELAGHATGADQDRGGGGNCD
jgi:hypothetical protein